MQILLDLTNLSLKIRLPTTSRTCEASNQNIKLKTSISRKLGSARQSYELLRFSVRTCNLQALAPLKTPIPIDIKFVDEIIKCAKNG